MVEHLDLDPPLGQLAGRQAVERLHRHPGKHAGIASRFHVAPFDDQLEVEELVARADHTDGTPVDLRTSPAHVHVSGSSLTRAKSFGPSVRQPGPVRR